MTIEIVATPLAANPRFAAHLRLLRALTAMQRAQAATSEARQLVARTRQRWASPTETAATDAMPGERPPLQLV